ncbi:MAG: phytoene synthase [Pseudonocardiales bacterium]|nr:MAG: phytoene synthase [Pseudonocardiales bacterium]
MDAARIDGAALRVSYDASRRLHARHGRTFYLATRLLPPAKRPHVHALYGFARWADDLVDTAGVSTARARLDRLRAELDHDSPASSPAVAALRDTVRRFGLPRQHLSDFLDAMESDLRITGYPTYTDLCEYMWGSAAVIGLLVLPVLGTADGVEESGAAPYAAKLGIAFQLTNFIRDVGEDLARGRIYLPEEDLARYGVDRDRLARGIADGPIRNLLSFEIERAREIYAAARPGIAMLHPQSRDCVEAACCLYSRILDAVERADYDVLRRRVSVPGWRRAAVGAPAWLRAQRAQRAQRTRRRRASRS